MDKQVMLSAYIQVKMENAPNIIGNSQVGVSGHSD